MEDHIDPVNNAYLTGLHTEIENIENAIGLNPTGTFETIAARLDNIDTLKYQPLLLDPKNAVLGTTAPATLTQIQTAYTSYWKIDFDKDTDEYANWILPILSKKSPISFKFTVYYKTSATAGNAWIEIDTRLLYPSGNAAFPSASSNVNHAIAPANATANCITTVEITISNCTSAAESIMQMILIYRKATEGTDTLDADLEVLGVKVEEA